MCELLKCASGRSGASGECSNTPINSQCEADAVANKLHIWITAAAAFFVQNHQHHLQSITGVSGAGHNITLAEHICSEIVLNSVYRQK